MPTASIEAIKNAIQMFHAISMCSTSCLVLRSAFRPNFRLIPAISPRPTGRLTATGRLRSIRGKGLTLHGIKGFVKPTKSFVKIGITKIFCYNNKMFSSIKKTFGCCSKIFGCSNKNVICCPEFCCRNKTIFFRVANGSS